MELSHLITYWSDFITIGLFVALFAISIKFLNKTSKRGYLSLTVAAGIYLVKEILVISIDYNFFTLNLMELGYGPGEISLLIIPWGITFSIMWWAFVALLIVAVIQFSRD